MLFMIISRTRPGLGSAEMEQLGEIAREFYGNIPSGIILHGDWTELDHSRTFALVEADDELMAEQIATPFRKFVDIEITAVKRVSGWGGS